MSRRGEKLEVLLGSFDDGPVPTHMGTVVQPERKVTGTDRFDVVFIPGGVGAGVQTKNETLLEFVRAHRDEELGCRELRWHGCIHRAGVLRDVQVTSSATLARRLAAQGTNVVNPRRAWKIIPEHKIFSAGGAGTVHPSSIALAWHLFGDEAGRELALGWDAMPLFGETLFSLEGPKMNDAEAARSKLQDAWEDVFLPA